MKKLIFENPPENFNSQLEVAACFILVRDKVLFMKRAPHKRHPNVWAIPGGKCEKNETSLETVVREVKEETGILLKDPIFKSRLFIRDPYADFIYHIFESRMHAFPSIELALNEHLEYQWVTFQEALMLPLIPGEDECIAHVYGIQV